MPSIIALVDTTTAPWTETEIDRGALVALLKRGLDVTRAAQAQAVDTNDPAAIFAETCTAVVGQELLDWLKAPDSTGPGEE